MSPAEMVKLNESKKYKFDTVVLCNGVKGEVHYHYKYPHTNFVMWENGVSGTYDDWWLDENVVVVECGEG